LRSGENRWNGRSERAGRRDIDRSFPDAARSGAARGERDAGSGTRLTRRGRVLAAVGAAVVIAVTSGALKLTGAIWASAPPAWVSALGAGVTVTGPGQAAPGHGSPGAAFAGVLASLSAKDPALACDYVFPGTARCGPAQVPRSQIPYGVSVSTGYVAIDGTRALLGFTGKICSPGSTPGCLANTNPAAIFSEGKTFGALWMQTVAPESGGTSSYALLPCAEVDGKWYFGAGAAAGGS
jgi:hypothetical protein